MMKRIAIAALLLASTSFAAEPLTATRTVILVRHAEKANTTHDTPLSETGKARAAELARVLATANVKTIITSELLRTKETAAPLAAKLGLTPVVVSTGAKNAEAVVAAIDAAAAGETVLVVGHSNTVPAIMKALGVVHAPEIDESEFGNLFVVTLPAGGAAQMLRLHY